MEQHKIPDRRKRAAENRADAPNPTRGAPRRAIDCGGASDDEAIRVRPQWRGDARHGYITSRGMYADQAQAI